MTELSDYQRMVEQPHLAAKDRTISSLRGALRLIAFANFERIEGTRSGTVILTIEELRHIRELVGAAPVSLQDGSEKP